MEWDGGGVAMEITGFQLEQQTTQRWGTTNPCPTADSHGGSVERVKGFQENMDASFTLQPFLSKKSKFWVWVQVVGKVAAHIQHPKHKNSHLYQVWGTKTRVSASLTQSLN